MFIYIEPDSPPPFSNPDYASEDVVNYISLEDGVLELEDGILKLEDVVLQLDDVAQELKDQMLEI